MADIVFGNPKCTVCGKQFTVVGMGQHLRKSHPDYKPKPVVKLSCCDRTRIWIAVSDNRIVAAAVNPQPADLGEWLLRGDAVHKVTVPSVRIGDTFQPVRFASPRPTGEAMGEGICECGHPAGDHYLLKGECAAHARFDGCMQFNPSQTLSQQIKLTHCGSCEKQANSQLPLIVAAAVKAAKREMLDRVADKMLKLGGEYFMDVMDFEALRASLEK